MKKTTHSLTNREVNDINTNGLEDKYEEFSNSDFSNEFEPLEKADNEIRASVVDKVLKPNKEADMKGTRREASYIGELSSGYDANVQDDYEAGKGDKGQIGKGHEEEVAKKNNWENDKRDAIGRAAASKELRKAAADMLKRADEIEKEIVDDVDDDLEEDELDKDATVEDKDDIVEGDDDEFEDVVDQVAADMYGSKKEAAEKTAKHPIEHDPKKDDPDANMDASTGDEWIDVGPGEFDDKRDDAHRAE